MTVAAILLAGGESSRMGRPKPLLDWGPLRPFRRKGSGQASTGLSERSIGVRKADRTGGQTLIEYQLAQLNRPPLDRIVVVLGHRADEIRPFVHAAGAQAIINEFYREGRASSLRVAAAALPEDAEAVLVLNVDQPRPHWVFQRLVEEHRRRGNLITVPTFDGRRGHPPLLAGSLLPEMREASEATQGLRALIQRHEADVRELPFDSDVVLLDINEPEEYDRARASYFQPSQSRQVLS